MNRGNQVGQAADGDRIVSYVRGDYIRCKFRQFGCMVVFIDHVLAPVDETCLIDRLFVRNRTPG